MTISCGNDFTSPSTKRKRDHTCTASARMISSSTFVDFTSDMRTECQERAFSEPAKPARSLAIKIWEEFNSRRTLCFTFPSFYSSPSPSSTLSSQYSHSISLSSPSPSSSFPSSFPITGPQPVTKNSSYQLQGPKIL